MSGDIKAAHGDEIMANESKTGNRKEVITVKSCRNARALLGEWLDSMTEGFSNLSDSINKHKPLKTSIGEKILPALDSADRAPPKQERFRGTRYNLPQAAADP